MVTQAEARPPSPGWYRYPATAPGLRFWDGTQFTAEFVADPPPSNAEAVLAAHNGASETEKPAPSASPASAAGANAVDDAAPDGTSGLPEAAAAEGGSTNSEGSLIGRLVALLTPLLAVAAGWVAGVVANAVPGVNLDTGQITAFMIAALTAVLAAGYKWLHGWQAHERRVAAGEETPWKVAGPPHR